MHKNRGMKFDLVKELYATPIKWSKNESVFENLHRITGRIVLGLWLPVLFVTTIGLLISFLMQPSAFIEKPKSDPNCEILETQDGNAIDTCDFLVP
jgi:hypothetical protein